VIRLVNVFEGSPFAGNKLNFLAEGFAHRLQEAKITTENALMCTLCVSSLAVSYMNFAAFGSRTCKNTKAAKLLNVSGSVACIHFTNGVTQSIDIFAVMGEQNNCNSLTV